MEIRVNYGSLEQAIRRMGAEVRDVHLSTYRLDDFTETLILLEDGIDLLDLKDLEVNAGGLLGYQGQQVVLYIPDQGWRVEDVLADGSKGRKVHVANCSVLEDMKRKGRYERYVVRNGLSPDFTVTGKTRDREELEGTAQLRVCMVCLKRLNYKNFNNETGVPRKAVVSEFSLDQFFATYSSYFKHMPKRSADEMASNRYSADWADVSKRYREGVKWQCEGSGCGVDLSGQSHRKFLHVHHINGVKGDNSDGNIKALCVDCHSKEEMHRHLRVSHKDRRVIQVLRKAQDLYKAAPQDSTDRDDWSKARMAADPAVHGLLFELEAQGCYSVPEVGQDVSDPKTYRVIYSNAELVWPETSEVVVLEKDEDCKALEDGGWKVFTAQELLDYLNDD